MILTWFCEMHDNLFVYDCDYDVCVDLILMICDDLHV